METDAVTGLLHIHVFDIVGINDRVRHTGIETVYLVFRSIQGESDILL